MWFSKKKRAAQEEAEILEDIAFRESGTPEEDDDYEASAVQHDEDRDLYTTHFYTDLTFLKSDEAAFDQLTCEQSISSSHYGPRVEGDRIVIEDLTLTSKNRDTLFFVRARLLALHELRASQKAAADQTAAEATFSELNDYMVTK